jgi:hypothetical protein
MTMYATDSDMERYCAQIAQALSEGDFSAQHTEVARVIDRDLIRGWYRPQCDTRGVDWTTVAFDRDDIEGIAALAPLGAFKALQLAGERLSQNPGTSEARDTWQEIRDHFRTRYEQELVDVLTVGLVYDWTSGEDDLVATAAPRRLRRA